MHLLLFPIWESHVTLRTNLIWNPHYEFRSYRKRISYTELYPIPNPHAMADEIDVGDIFHDPEGYYPPEKEPTFAEHHMLSGQTVRVRLVGSHPLYVRAPV